MSLSFGAYWGSHSTVIHGPALGVVQRLLARHLATRAGLRGRPTGRSGAVMIIQRSGSAENLTIYLHCLALDGAYRVGADAPAPRPGLRCAAVLRRIDDVDRRTCPNCGLGTLEPIATILARDAIARGLGRTDADTAACGRRRMALVFPIAPKVRLVRSSVVARALMPVVPATAQRRIRAD